MKISIKNRWKTIEIDHASLLGELVRPLGLSGGQDFGALKETRIGAYHADNDVVRAVRAILQSMARLHANQHRAHVDVGKTLRRDQFKETSGVCIYNNVYRIQRVMAAHAGRSPASICTRDCRSRCHAAFF